MNKFSLAALSLPISLLLRYWLQVILSHICWQLARLAIIAFFPRSSQSLFFLKLIESLALLFFFLFRCSRTLCCIQTTNSRQNRKWVCVSANRMILLSRSHLSTAEDDDKFGEEEVIVWRRNEFEQSCFVAPVFFFPNTYCYSTVWAG